MRRSIRVLIALLVLISLSGCATVLKGSNEKVSFSSDPSGAEIYINGQYMGKTPLQINLRSKDVYSIEFRKQGYEPKVVQLNSKASATMGFHRSSATAGTSSAVGLRAPQLSRDDRGRAPDSSRYRKSRRGTIH